MRSRDAKSWLCRKSARQRIRGEGVFLGGTGEGGAIALQGMFLHAGQHLIPVLGQLVEIVDQVDR